MDPTSKKRLFGEVPSELCRVPSCVGKLTLLILIPKGLRQGTQVAYFRCDKCTHIQIIEE